MKARTGLPTLLTAATVAIFYQYHGVTAQVVNDTVITYPGAGIQWNSTDQIVHRAYRDVDKIPPGYLEGALLELQHESFATPMNLASNVNVSQCHKLIPVPAVNDSDASASVVVNYPVGAVTSSSSVEDASETGIGTPVAIIASSASSSATASDDPSSSSIVPSNSAVEEGMQGMRRRHAMPNPYPYPDGASVTTVTSLTTVTTTVQASGAGPSATSDASAALSSAEAALSSASLAMSSASAALASVSAGMSASSPTSDLAPSASTDTSGSEAKPTDAAPYDASGSATTAAPSGTSSDGPLDGQEDDTPAYAPSSTGTAAQTTSTSFVGAYFALNNTSVSTLREGLGTRPAQDGKTENVRLADITATMIVPAYARGPLI